MAEKNLLDEIDRTALDLLSKIRAEDILSEKVKAFGEIVKWAEVRSDLIPKEAPPTKFASIKESFHAASGTPRSRRSARPSPAEAGNGADPAAPGAGAPEDG